MHKHLLLLIVLLSIAASGIAQEPQPDSDSNFRKAVAAAGGSARFKTLQAPTMWMETGTYYGMGEGIPFVNQYASYWPKRWYRQLVEGQFAIGVAGEQVTIFMPGDTNGTKLTGEIQDAALHQARVGWAQLLYPLFDDDYTISNIEGVDVDGKATVGVRAKHKSGSELKLYFDARTFLLAKSTATLFAREKGGMVESETFYSQHQSFGGVTLPGKYRTLYDGELFTEGEITAIKVHATIDPAWFGVEGPARVR